MKKVMIIDGLNMFLRSYIIIPSMDPRGNPNGGTWGFLKSLQKICKKFNPDEIVVCWDGVGGSEKKRTINKNYKQGRKPLRFNRRMIDLTPKAQEENKAYQQVRLMSYLNDMPIIQTMIDYVEADDVIAYVAQHERYKDWEKIIISSDKDFFQLVEGNCTLYRPIQDTLLEQKNIMEQYGIHPRNFALARAMEGDKSDNLPGVPRVGLKTVKSRFSFMSSSVSHEPEDIFKFCENVEKPIGVHKNILQYRDLIESNYKLMQLYSPNISKVHKKQINFAISEFDKSYVKMEILKKMAVDGIDSGKFSNLFLAFKRITK
jgi:DNA polymerase-1